MSPFTIALVVGAIVLVLLVIGMYNNLVTLKNNVQEAWSAIDTELRRRYDLIPNLVETVKGYAGHERETLEAVIRARNATVTSGPLDAQVNSQNALSNALGRLFAVSEAYPQLKANENFTQLQNELQETETRISQARRFYNANVKEYNTACQSFPGVLFAVNMGFKAQPYYGIDDPAAFEPVSISFNKQQDQGSVLKVPDKQTEKNN
jgi:LemA protein